MSTAKVIFTYKRKRLSSCSGVGDAAVSPDFSLDVHADKHQANPKEGLGSSEKDPMISEGVNYTDVDCSTDTKSCLEPSNHQFSESRVQVNELSDNSSPQLHDTIAIKMKHQVQKLDTSNSGETQLGSTELAEDNDCKASGKQISTGAALLETTVLINKNLCLDLDSSCSLDDGCIQDDSVLQSLEQPNSHSKQRSMSGAEVSKRKSTVPLLTFSRRLKRKPEAGSSVTSEELPTKEGASAVKEREAISVPLSSCEVTLNKMRAAEKSSAVKVENDDVVTGNVSCLCREEMTGKESRDSSYSCAASHADIPALRQTEEKRYPQDECAVDISFVTKQSASALSGSDALETTNLQKHIALRSSDDELLSSCDGVSKTDGQHVSNGCRSSSGDSQLTSNDCSDVKTFAEKSIRQMASSASMDPSCPPSGGFVIDCNVIPESDIQDRESETVQPSPAIAENSERVMQEVNLKRKGLELFGDADLQVVDSPSSHVVRSRNHLRTSVAAEKKPETKYLQLFSEDGQSGLLAPANTTLETGSSSAQQNASYSLHCERLQLEQAARKVSATVGLSLAVEPTYEGQTSRHGSGMHLFQDHNVSVKELIQNPAMQSFPDQSSFMWRQKVLLESCNTRATALRGNRNISLDRFEPRPAMWSEEELDSLWIGVRRHGRGNWHAMLLDPKLRFAPWRVARDLADQWEREQCQLLIGQPIPEERILKHPDMYNVDSRGRFMHSDAHAGKENLSTVPQLSLGDLYARREGSYLRSNGQNQSHMYVTVASKVGNCSNTSFNTMQTSVMIGGDGFPYGRGKGLALDNHLPHWLREPTSTPSRFSEPSPPQVSAMPQTRGLQIVRPSSDPPGTSCGRRNLNNYKAPGTVTGEVQPPGGLLKGKQIKTENLIVIDSDASSEETISDDRNVRN